MMELDEREIEQLIERILERRPDLLARALAAVLPQNLATKQDLETLARFLEKRFEDLIHHSDQRFQDYQKATDKRFQELFQLMDSRFQDYQKATDKRLGELIRFHEHRFEDLNRRLNLLLWIVLAFNIPILVGIVGLLLRVLIGG